uniref:SCP domain-containing protein n=1 Tax=Macrostomum lignano TaxID=282301 RepID=A0A1I8I3K6_9PLAT
GGGGSPVRGGGAGGSGKSNQSSSWSAAPLSAGGLLHLTSRLACHFVPSDSTKVLRPALEAIFSGSFSRVASLCARCGVCRQTQSPAWSIESRARLRLSLSSRCCTGVGLSSCSPDRSLRPIISSAGVSPARRDDRAFTTTEALTVVPAEQLVPDVEHFVLLGRRCQCVCRQRCLRVDDCVDVALLVGLLGWNALRRGPSGQHVRALVVSARDVLKPDVADRQLPHWLRHWLDRGVDLCPVNEALGPAQTVEDSGEVALDRSLADAHHSVVTLEDFESEGLKQVAAQDVRSFVGDVECGFCPDAVERHWKLDLADGLDRRSAVCLQFCARRKQRVPSEGLLERLHVEQRNGSTAVDLQSNQLLFGVDRRDRFHAAHFREMVRLAASSAFLAHRLAFALVSVVASASSALWTCCCGLLMASSWLRLLAQRLHIWREHLAQYAEREANELCYIVHQTDTVWYIKMGDSWLSYQTTENVLPTAWQIVDAWHSTGRSYRSTGACSGENTNCQPYLQIMSDKLDSLGCAYYLCHGVHTFVCYYSHKAAVHGSRVYAVGEPCSACPNSLPLCLNNLCIDKMIVRDPTVPVYKGSDSSQRPFCTRDCETCEQRLIGQCRRCDCSNGGTRRPEATPSNCRCTCPIGYFGRQCQVTLARYKNSVALRLGVRGPGKLSMSLEPDLLQQNQNGELMVYVRAAMVSAIQDPVLCYHSDKLNPKTNPPS